MFCFCCKMGVKGDEVTDLITRKRFKCVAYVGEGKRLCTNLHDQTNVCLS